VQYLISRVVPILLVGIMLFCPKCGSIMVTDRSKGVMKCPRCGYTMNAREGLVLSKSIAHSVKDKTAVVEASSDVPPNAVLLRGEVQCPKCGHDEVYAWQMQTRSADEPPTTFYKCAKCGHRWREY